MERKKGVWAFNDFRLDDVIYARGLMRGLASKDTEEVDADPRLRLRSFSYTRRCAATCGGKSHCLGKGGVVCAWFALARSLAQP